MLKEYDDHFCFAGCSVDSSKTFDSSKKEPILFQFCHVESEKKKRE